MKIVLQLTQSYNIVFIYIYIGQSLLDYSVVLGQFFAKIKALLSGFTYAQKVVRWIPNETL